MSRLSRHVFHPLWDLKDGSRRLRILRELERSQWRPVEELRAVQWHRLQEIVRYAGAHSAYYQRLFSDCRFDSTAFDLSQFRALPVLTKGDIRRSTDEIVSDEHPRESLGYHKTGGSTGTSLTTYFNREWLQVRTADAMRSDQWAGYFHGMKVAAIWGNPPAADTLKKKLRALLLDRVIYLDTMNLNDRTMAALVEQWRHQRPQIVFGHSHSIFMFARFLRERGIADLRPKGVIATSMMLIPSERRVIEQAFSCKVTDRYGCEEVALIACECEQHHGYHLNIEHLFIEFMRSDGQPARAGEEGAIVITDLLNRGMPLIRYRVEDVGVPSDRRCACGRGMPLMERVIGRVADYLKRLDGSLVAGVSLVERALTAFEGIEQMQIEQPTRERLVLRLVRAANFSQQTRASVLKEFRDVFGREMVIDMEYVDRIPQERSGKYRFSICRI